MREVLRSVVVLGLLASCESSTQTVATNPESRLRLLPQELTPLAGCQQSSQDPAELYAYVATLIDVQVDDKQRVKPKTIVSGPPTNCTSAITFAVSADRGELTVGHPYVALVDGYTMPGLEAIREGKRPVAVNGVSGSPRWQWLCGFGDLPSSAISDLLDIAQEIPRESAPPLVVDAATSSDTPVADAGDEVTLFEASVADATTAHPRDAATLDAATPTTAVIDSGNAAESQAGQATSDAPPPEPPVMKSALDILLEISQEPATAPPAVLAQSRLGTLRGCVALP